MKILLIVDSRYDHILYPNFVFSVDLGIFPLCESILVIEKKTKLHLIISFISTFSPCKLLH